MNEQELLFGRHMPARKVVATPDGPRVVIHDLDRYVEDETERYNRHFVEKHDGLYCRRCGRPADGKTVVHLIVDASEQLVDPTTLPKSSVLKTPIQYCYFCDEIPEEGGEPIASLGSYYNRPH